VGSRTHWGGLDGLRALAVLAVLGTHFGFLGTNAVVGVDLFFVISGFLITTLLLKERDQSGALSLTNFWTRRALRLLPALVCAVGFAVALSLFASSSLRHQTLVGLPWVFLYVGNWVKASGGATTLGLLVHTWSLAVEEQFYIVWPIVAAFCICRRSTRRRTAARMLVVLAGLDCLYFLWAVRTWGGHVAFFRTDTHAFGLLAGCAMAVFLSEHEARGVALSRLLRRGLQVAAPIALAIFCLICVAPTTSASGAAMLVIAGTVASVVLVSSVVLVPHTTLPRLLSSRVGRWFGRRSYGIYLYHFPLAVVLVQASIFHGLAHFGAITLGAAASVAIAAASYRWVELPFLRYKKRFAGISSQTEFDDFPDVQPELEISST
jgi:peptidoglycan/LPS O-acetylase OafA/YrhL